jgi:anti-sigma factor RsiW
MNCPLQMQSLDLLLDYSAGRLNAPARFALEEHMERCAECAAFRVEQTAVWEALDLWSPPPVTVDFNRRLWKRIDESANRPWYQALADTFRLADYKPLIPLTAAVAVIVAGFLLDHPSPMKPATGFTANEANQVEQALDDIQLLHQFDVAQNAAAADGGSKTM